MISASVDGTSSLNICHIAGFAILNGVDMRSQIFYAQEINGVFCHMYESKAQVKMCGDEPIIQVRVRDLKKKEKSMYWAVWHTKKTLFKQQQNTFSMIYDMKMKVEMCSPDGFEREVRDGEAEIVNVMIEKI